MKSKGIPEGKELEHNDAIHLSDLHPVSILLIRCLSTKKLSPADHGLAPRYELLKQNSSLQVV